MIAEIDDLFRRFQSDLGPLPQESRERILSRARSGDRRASAKRPRRMVTVIAGAACLGAIVIAAFALRNAGQTPTVSADAPRVEWGRTALVRVIPDAGVSADVAMDRAAKAIHHRARKYDIPGVRLEQAGADTLRITVPGAINEASVPQLTSFGSIAVYNRTADRLASYTTIAEMKEGFRQMTSGEGGFLLVSRGTTSFVGGEWVATRDEADRKLALLNAPVPNNPERQWEAIPVPDGDLRLIASNKPYRMDVIANRPILTAADIIDVTANGNNELRLTISPEARSRIDTTADGDVVVVARAQGPYSSPLGSMTRDSDGNLIITTDDHTPAQSITPNVGSPPVPAELRVATSEPYGTRPPLRGEHVVTLPEPVEKMRAAQFNPSGDGIGKLAIPVNDVVRVVAATHAGKDASVYAARTPDGLDIFYPMMGMGGGNVCEALAGPTSLTLCPQAFTGEDPIVFAGRIGDPAITRVQIRSRTRSTVATVDNGWFIAVVAAADADVRQYSPHVTIVGMNDRDEDVAALASLTGEITRNDVATNAP